MVQCGIVTKFGVMVKSFIKKTAFGLIRRRYDCNLLSISKGRSDKCRIQGMRIIRTGLELRMGSNPNCKGPILGLRSHSTRPSSPMPEAIKPSPKRAASF